MPVHTGKGKGKRPFKIREKGGKVVGSSTTKAKAEASARARNQAFAEKKRRR